MFPVRYSVLIGAFLPLWVWVSIPHVSPIAGLPRLLFGLFVLSRPIQLFNVTWISHLIAAMVLITLRVCWLNAPRRLVDYREIEMPWIDGPNTFRWRYRWIWFFLMGLPIPTASLVATSGDPVADWAGYDGIVAGDSRVWISGAVAIALGVLVAMSLLGLLGFFQQLLIAPDVRVRGILPFENFGWAHRLNLVNSRVLRWLRSAGNRGWLVWPGYTRVQAEGVTAELRLEPGHLQLILYAVILITVYFASYVAGWQAGWIPDERSAFPALFFGLLALLLVACLLPGTSFFLDYYRIPAWLAILVVAWLTYWLRPSDHLYAVNPPGDNRSLVSESVDVHELLSQRAVPPGKDGQRTLVVVAASGGGIQASAWTAQVLTGLHQRYGNPFSRSIGVISSVSGGSVGTMFYLINREDFRTAAFARQSGPAGDLLPPEAIEHIRDVASGSGLEATAWGIAYPDMVRKLFPLLAHPRVDRGWAIEQVWRRRMAVLNAPGKSFQDARLSDLARRARDHGIPIVVFNSTVVETGQRMLISPAVSRASSDVPAFSAPQEFLRLYPESQLPLSTAVRLSATFPYVSPISRPDWERGTQPANALPYHLADGAYSDNDGIVTLVDWLETLVHHQTELPFDRVVLVRIQPFPTDRAPNPPLERAGWLLSATGPLQAIMNVRVASQNERGLLEARLVESHHRGGHAIPLSIVSFVFPAEENEPLIPLSWKLTPSQKARIENAWRRIVKQNASHFQELDTCFSRID